MIATGSWDKAIKYWDIRLPTSIGIIHLPERLYAMDVCDSLLVADIADNKIHFVDVGNPTVIMRTNELPLEDQMRKIRCFQEADEYATSSVEGRVGITYTEKIDQE